MINSSYSDNYEFIDTQSALDKLVGRILKTDAIALDTEFHGERRYYPDLFLIQIADADGT